MDIRPLQREDHKRWLVLWDENNQGLADPAVSAETWNRLMTPIYGVHGLAAFDGKTITGFLHYILHPVTGHINPVCYMQDLYVDPAHRRKGAARALVAELARIGAAERWPRIYWFAENGNLAAQRLYRNFGVKLDFSMHVLPLA